MRIGHGYDVHKLVEGRPLILGGVTIPFEKGLLGHSDADVLLHAISDALLGAAALGDIGHLFPDTDDRWKGADSLKLLEEVVRVLADRGYQIENIDATLLAQRPKLAPYIDEMRGNIADACRVDIAQVSVKATTETKARMRAAVFGICVNLCLFMVKLYVGISTNSISIYVDSLNNALDSVVCIIALVGFWLSVRTSPKYPFGLGRAEDLTGFITAVVIVGTGFGFGYVSLERTLYPAPVWFSV